MDYTQVEEKFKTLKLQFLTGALDEASFKAQLDQLMVQDESGRWWMIGYETGHWYTHDGNAWVRSEPPERTPPKPVREEKVEFSPSLVATVQKAKYGGEPVSPIPASGEKIKLGPLPQAETAKKMGWGFWLKWLGAAAAGGIVFIAMISDYNFIRQAGYFWTLVIPISIIGILQWLIMRQYFEGSGWWVLVNVIYAGIDGGLVSASNSSYSYNSPVYYLAIIMMLGYPVFNLIAGPVWVARKRGTD